jgi:hypothetical protein
MHFLLGLIVSVCYIPGTFGALVPIQWAVLSILLPLGLWSAPPIGLDHKLGLALLGWATLSLGWSPNTFDALYGLWIAFIWAGAFWVGSLTDDSRPLWCGLAFGLAINSGVAIAQALGHSPVLMANETPSGLLFNSTVLGSACALVLIALISWRLWFWVPFLIPGLLLSQSRGALAVLGFTLLASRVRWYYTIATLAFALAAMSLFAPPSDLQRLFLWGTTLRGLTLLGHGIGSYTTLLIYNPTEFYRHAAGMIHPEFVHNDYLQLWFELGAAAILVYALALRGLLRPCDPDWPVLCAVAILGIFYFPLWCPVLAFIGCAAAGAIAGRRIRGGDFVHNRGPIFSSWSDLVAARLNRHRGEALPVQSPT